MIPFANNKQKLYLLKRHCFYKDQSNSSEDPSVQFSRSVLSDSFQPHGLQHASPIHHQLPEFTQTHVH